MDNSEIKTVSPDVILDTVVDMAVESWRFAKVFERLLLKLDLAEQSRYQNQFRWFMKKVDEALAQSNLKVVNVEGQPFDLGVAATPLNIEEFSTTDILYIDQMVEPIIMGNFGIIRTGTITLKKHTEKL